MKIGRTLVLFVLLIALAAYVYFVEYKQHNETEQLKEASKKVVQFQEDSLLTITIKNQYGHFELGKTISEDWRILKPLDTEADQSVVKTLINNLKNARKDNEFKVKPSELPDYGLDARALVVHLKMKNGQEDSVRFGDKTPVGAFVFANKVDTLVFTTNDYIRNAFDKKLFDLRDKRLLVFQVSDVNGVTLKNPYGTFQFKLLNPGQWEIASIKRLADEGKINSLLNKLTYSRVKAFVDESGKQLRKYGLSRPAYFVELNLGPDKGTRKLIISRKIGGKYYAKDEARTPIFEIDPALIKELNRKLIDFRSKRLVRFDREKVTKFIVTYSDTVVTAVKDQINNRWILPDTARTALSKTKVNTFFSDLEFTTIEKFVKDGPYNAAVYGLDKPSLHITFYKDNAQYLDVRFGKIRGKSVYAASNQYDSVYLVPVEKFKKLKIKLADLKEPSVVEQKRGKQVF